MCASQCASDRRYASRAVSTDELCVVSRQWWTQPWNRELSSNNRQVCCDRQRILSSYRTALLLNHTRNGFAFAFFAGLPSGERRFVSRPDHARSC